MKRVLAVLGVFALLGTLFVLASSSPASAEPNYVEIYNADGYPSSSANPITVTAVGCGWTRTAEPVEIPVNQTGQLELDTSCSPWTVTAVDSLGQCTVEWDQTFRPGSVGGAGGWQPQNTVEVDGDTLTPLKFRTTDDCVTNNPIELEKDWHYEEDYAAVQMSTYTFDVLAWASTIAGGADTTSPCAGSNTSVQLMGGEYTDVSVLNGYIADNQLVDCYYGVFEVDIPAGQYLYSIVDDCGGNGNNVDLGVSHVNPQGYRDCLVEFDNALEDIPMVITKTFTGRDYYTTIDRADFHIMLPGVCGAVPFDPFGGLLGSVGVFRTINASQEPQLVFALPDIFPASGAGACTYRVQENNAPDGCVALNPDGSTADGPYWEQTWVPGMTEMVFNIVNDCADTPEPTPEPTVAPTTTPKKPGAPGAKKPSSGGSAAPKFTG